MSHHGNNPFDDFKSEDWDKLKKQIDGSENGLSELMYDLNHKKSPLGATGTFPAGKLNEQDEGGIMFGITVREGKLIINFGEKPVTWVGLTKTEVVDLIKYLNNRISELK